jgi:hydroxymethylpyrimidine/phosphomethylpyrimidine kinase
MLSAHCAILLKGGHHPEKLVSILYIQKREILFLPKKSSLTEKHGSGCVLSSAIVSNLAFRKRFKHAISLRII